MAHWNFGNEAIITFFVCVLLFYFVICGQSLFRLLFSFLLFHFGFNHYTTLIPTIVFVVARHWLFKRMHQQNAIISTWSAKSRHNIRLVETHDSTNKTNYVQSPISAHHLQFKVFSFFVPFVLFLSLSLSFGSCTRHAIYTYTFTPAIFLLYFRICIQNIIFLLTLNTIISPKKFVSSDFLYSHFSQGFGHFSENVFVFLDTLNKNANNSFQTNVNCLLFSFGVASLWDHLTHFWKMNDADKQTNFSFKILNSITMAWNLSFFEMYEHRYFLLFSFFSQLIFSCLQFDAFLPTLDYDKTICASLLYQYIWWFTLYLPCFLYLVQASTVNFKAYCVHTTSTLSSISLCLWVCLLLCMQGAFNQSAKLSNFFSATHSPIFAQYCEIIS